MSSGLGGCPERGIILSEEGVQTVIVFYINNGIGLYFHCYFGYLCLGILHSHGLNLAKKLNNTNDCHFSSSVTTSYMYSTEVALINIYFTNDYFCCFLG
jgi:hypothetical protein